MTSAGLICELADISILQAEIIRKLVTALAQVEAWVDTEEIMEAERRLAAIGIGEEGRSGERG